MTACAGFWRRRARRGLSVAVVGLLAVQGAPAGAKPQRAIDLPPSTLADALITLSRTTGVDIISTEPGLREVRTRAVTGRLPVRAALDRLLAGTGFRAAPMTGGGYRVVFVGRPSRPAPPRRQTPAAPTPAPAPAPSDVVVTASKQRTTLLAYPGSLAIVRGTPTLPGGAVAAPSDLGRILPVIQSTQLGPGRNKVFIRGIADSSFNGTTLSTVSVYLDDVQLSGSGPDPGLRLYDLKDTEVLEGPQGTLYGAGSIGGVIRLTSNAPDLARASGSISGSIAATASGEPGGDAAVVANLPLVTDRLGLRGVAYAVREGGYIDDRGRGRSNVNRTDIAGARLGTRFASDGWRLEASGAWQVTHSRDGQYALAGSGALARPSAVAQPFTGRFRIGRLVTEKAWDNGLRFVTATGVSAYDTAEIFDATPAGGALATVRADTEKLLVSHEMRLTRSRPGGGSWLIGGSFASERSVLRRSAGVLGSEADLTGVRNLTRTASPFAELTVPVTRKLLVTGGARFTIAQVDSEPSAVRRAEPFVDGQTTRRIDPTLAVSWQLAPRLAAFARHQTGFRTGGLAVARGVGRVANFDLDSIDLNEAGLRRLRSAPTGLELSMAFSIAKWRHIQADLISRRGQPYTANIGDATVRTLEAIADWRPVTGLRLAGSAVVTDNSVTGPLAQRSLPRNRRLPETPSLGAYGEVAYAWPAERRFTPDVAARITYVGQSVLGTGDLLDARQGGYAVGSLEAGLHRGARALSLRIDNLTDSRANRFAFGNPTGIAARNQITPLQPRTVRLGFRNDF